MAKLYSFQTAERNTFGAADYVIFAGLLCFSASIGLFYAIKDRRKNNTRDFLLAGGNMSAIPVALSLLASFMSAITLLGTPAEMYNYTTMYWWIGLGYFFTILAATHVYIPIFYNLRVTSAYEYLERRFGKPTRTAASLIYVLQMILYMAIVLYAPSLALNAVTGFTLWGSVMAVGLVCIFYTTLGGMKAVLWTDTFQVGLMIAGLLAVLIQGSIEVGGFENAWRIAAESGRIWFTDFNPDPAVRHSFWTCVFGGGITWLAVYGGNQAQIQRAITCPTLRKAQYAYWFNFPGLCIILYLCCLIGIVIYALYRTCDPQSLGLITAADQLLPLFVMDVLGHMPGLPGLFVSCLFSGALSTLSSGLNSIAAVILQDVIRAYFFKDLDDVKATYVSKLLALVFGFICLGLTYVASLLGGVLQAALALFGVIGGPILGVFTLGMLFPWANQCGALTGMITSLTFMLWIAVGYQVHKPFVGAKSTTSIVGCNWNLTSTVPTVTSSMFANNISTVSDIISQNITTAAPVVGDESILMRLYSLSYLWYSATAVLVVVGVGLIVSFATGHTKASTVDGRLICPLFDIMFPFLPEKFRKPLRFGVDHSVPKGKYDTEFDIGETKDLKSNGDLENGDIKKPPVEHNNAVFVTDEKVTTKL